MGMREFVSNKIKIKSEKRKFNKQYLETQNVLKNNVGYNAQALFNPTVLSWIFLAVTFFLQIISLATTYSGSKVYFGGIKLPLGLNAPLLFALSVQLIVFSISNSLKRNFRLGTIIILLSATLCSTYFSYIGIYNYMNSPIIYLEEKYNQIFHNMSDKYRTVVDNSKNEIKKYVYDITGKVQKEHIRLVTENENYSKLAQEVSKVSMNTNIVTPNTRSVVKPNIKNYGNNLEQYYADIAKYNSAIASITGQAATQNSSAQMSVYENKIKTILGGKTLAEFNKEAAASQANMQALKNLVSSLYNSIPNSGGTDFDKMINEIQQYCINYINTVTGDKNIFSSILTNMHTVYSDITSEETPKEFNQALNFFFTASEKTESFMRSLKDIERNVYLENYEKEPVGDTPLALSDALLLYSKLQSEIKNGAYILDSLSEDGRAIDLNNESYSLENMYVLPIKNLFTNSSALRTAWFCFAFAALIDGLTLLFALISRGNNKVLMAKRNKEIVKDNEELTEDLLFSSLILHRVEDTGKSTTQCCLEHLATFLTSFRITPIGMEEGFSLYCPLNKLKEYQVFLSILCQFNLAKLISAEDFELLLTAPKLEDFEYYIREQDSTAVIDEVAAASFENHKGSYVLLRTKFIIWVNQKLAIAASDKELSAIMKNILKGLDEQNNTTKF